MTTLIFGHKNPDTDSIASAIVLSYLKNVEGYSTKPCMLGSINRETEFVLNYFGVETPTLIDNVKIQLKDLELDRVKGVLLNSSIIEIFNMFENDNIKTVPLLDNCNHLVGIVTMKDIAIGLVNGNIHYLETRLTHITNSLDGKILAGKDTEVKGTIAVIAYYSESVFKELTNFDIIIVGDRYKIIEEAIKAQVKLIIITGNKDIPSKLIDLAEKKNVPIITVKTDTYTTAKLINHCNYITSVITNNEIIQFNENDYLSEVKEEMINSNYRNYPVVNQNGEYIGFVNKKEIISPHKKKVILVDHNEINQSALGLREADIIEIVDHHKIGDIVTDGPINFTNIPIGSTCTIIYQMMKERNIEIPYNMAGLLISGIISDTLALNSPTSTEHDKKALIDLNDILNLDIEVYTMEMFKAGTSLEGYSESEVFNKDFKEFNIEDYKIGISQVFTLNTDSVIKRKEAFIEYIKKVSNDNGYYLTIMLITDIIKNGSYIFFESENNKIISLAFEVESLSGDFLEGVISRKKQVVPRISYAFRNI